MSDTDNTRSGTCHFASRKQLEAYYKVYGCTVADVQQKLDEGAVAIGPPVIAEGSLHVDSDGRYHIISGKRKA